MLAERNEGEITAKVREFIASTEDEGVTIYPLSYTEFMDEKYNVSFCAAGFVVDPRGEKVDFVSFTADGTLQMSKNFLREIFEWDFESSGEVEEIEQWLEAADAAYFEQGPLFAISFGVYENSKQKAVFIHAKNGVSLGSAVSVLKKYAEINLFGKELDLGL